MRNVLAVVAGFIAGSVVNLGLVMTGPSLIPLPPGVDPADPESISASMHLFEARHFIMPFAAHALGTLAGAVVAFVIAARQSQMAWVIGALFFAGGAYASTVIPAPTWFIITDLVLAYFPMAWLGILIGGRIGSRGAQHE
jgi:hypothetical protein